MKKLTKDIKGKVYVFIFFSIFITSTILQVLSTINFIHVIQK